MLATIILVPSCLLALTLSAPTTNVPAVAEIVELRSDLRPDGSYEWSYESSDGTKQGQSGVLKEGEDATEPILVVQGAASWIDPDGKKHQFAYVADENGFQPQGDDIPQPPAIPEPIARALKWIEAHPDKEEEEEESKACANCVKAS